MSIALITGAAGGIGSATSLQLAKDGFDVFLLDRNSQALDALRQKIQMDLPNIQVMTAAVDLSKPEEIHAFFSKYTNELKNLEVLVNNAGISIGSDIFSLKIEDWDLDQHVNLRAPFLLIQHAIGMMKDRKTGSIINISSLAGIQGAKKPNYASSKAGILGLTKSVAQAVGPFGIRVNAVFPGAVDTNLIADWSEEKRNAIIQQTALRRIAKPEDIAKVISFLASDKAGFVTGSVINVTGGQYFGQ